jgi:hypothetical protein
METITDQLNAVAAAIPVIQSAENSKVLSSFFCSFAINRDGKTAEELKEIINWFVDGGKFTSYWKESLPYGERKNSKKRQKTTWFFAEKSGVTFQLGHVTVKNYVGDFWERGAEALVKSALCKAGEFSYYNNSFVNYALESGAEFTDLGEKK